MGSEQLRQWQGRGVLPCLASVILLFCMYRKGLFMVLFPVVPFIDPWGRLLKGRFLVSYLYVLNYLS